MVCVYCGGETSVVNSRPQKKLNQIWRRRACLDCGATTTSTETYSLAGAFQVWYPGGEKYPFCRDRLFLSVYASLEHRKDAVEAASALTSTIIMQLFGDRLGASITSSDIIGRVTDTLTNFDHAASVYYASRHQP